MDLRLSIVLGLTLLCGLQLATKQVAADVVADIIPKLEPLSELRVILNKFDVCTLPPFDMIDQAYELMSRLDQEYTDKSIWEDRSLFDYKLIRAYLTDGWQHKRGKLDPNIMIETVRYRAILGMVEAYQTKKFGLSACTDVANPMKALASGHLDRYHNIDTKPMSLSAAIVAAAG